MGGDTRRGLYKLAACERYGRVLLVDMVLSTSASHPTANVVGFRKSSRILSHVVPSPANSDTSSRARQAFVRLIRTPPDVVELKRCALTAAALEAQDFPDQSDRLAKRTARRKRAYTARINSTAAAEKNTDCAACCMLRVVVVTCRGAIVIAINRRATAHGGTGIACSRLF